MSTYSEEPSFIHFTPTLSPIDGQGPPSNSPSAPKPGRPAGWRRLPLRLRGANVYRVTPPTGGNVYWHAEMTLNGEQQSRRCASELYALWWIAALKEPPAVVETFVMAELNEPLQCDRERRA